MQIKNRKAKGKTNMAKYKVGDRVKVRKDLGDQGVYYMEGEYFFGYATKNMLELAGKIVTIREIVSTIGYCIYEDGRIWTDEMFERLATEN